RRDENETLRPETGAERIDEFMQRQDAAAADQPLRLDSEGDEGEEGDKPEQAKEQERDKLVARRLRVPAPQHEAQAKEGAAAMGDEGVSNLGDGREAGQAPVKRKPEPLAARLREGEETGMRRARPLPLGRDELHRALKFRFRNRWVLRKNLLIGAVFDAIARQPLPVAGPIEAEPAIAVVDEPRARGRGRRFNQACGLSSGSL